MASSKITKVHGEHREWKSPNGGSIYYRTIELENGDVGSIGTKEVQPDWLQEQKILEYTLDKAKGKITKSKPDFKGGGGFKKKDNTITYEELIRKAKKSALSAAVETEKNNHEISRRDAFSVYFNFIMDLDESYKSGVDKWGKSMDYFIDRSFCVHSSSDEAFFNKEITLDGLKAHCEKTLKYLYG
jgi:hypothetical protein